MDAQGSAAGAPWPSSGERPIRAAEVVGALSLATDLGTGQPLEHALRTAVIAVRLGELAGASVQELVDAYYVALLHSSGCTSDGHEAAQIYGDDIVPRAAFALVDAGNPEEVVAFLRSNVGLGRTPELRAVMVEEAIAHGLPAGPPDIGHALRGGAAIRRMARIQFGHPGGTRTRLRALGRAGVPGCRRRRGDPIADAAGARRT